MNRQVTSERLQAPPATGGVTRAAISTFFLILGLGFGSWVVRIPDVQNQLHLSKGALGGALLAVTVGSLIGMPLAGWLTGRIGSARVLRASAVVLAVGVALPAYAGSWWGLCAVLVVLGLGNGAEGVAMNVQGALLERNRQQAIMSSFHGVFSIGGLIGSLAGGALADAGVSPRAHLTGVAVLLLLLTAVAGLRLLPTPPDPGRQGHSFALPGKPVVAAGLVAFCVLFGEGAVSDWSAVYLKNDLDAAALAGIGYAAFAGAMAVGRMAGDRLASALGAHRLVTVGGLLGAAGITVAVLVPVPYTVVLGFGLMGAGLSVVYPQMVSAAGRTPGMVPDVAIAAVSTVGYFGFLVGPPAIGGLAEVMSLRWALLLVAVCAAVIVVLSGHALRDAEPVEQ
ncbi:MFS transporter [Streptosporangium carneum]|uniref:MFS transporter n=1 Tax=Streptosporangium carneum TaxID=47481 RepID=A0A9W6MI83_9ACTN|nr:MFS transporter [Streptosporangium carneum]GLK14982.1 MFS transporter [Streptosporangium carneum]